MCAGFSSPDVSAHMKPLPSSAPCWALRLRNAQVSVNAHTHTFIYSECVQLDLLLLSCQQKLGDSFRGFCCSEAELEAILLLHKQQTGCVFGTRQSPSVDKPATRLMWKSQYVPYDGIPFVNTGPVISV